MVVGIAGGLLWARLVCSCVCGLVEGLPLWGQRGCASVVGGRSVGGGVGGPRAARRLRGASAAAAGVWALALPSKGRGDRCGSRHL